MNGWKNCGGRRRWRVPLVLKSMKSARREILNLYPGLNVEDAVGGVHLAKDGQGDPVNITQALAKGARNGGAKS